MRAGRVALVGAGPGDPDLLTIKALRLLGEADVVVYDRLVSDDVLALIPAGTPRIFAGKRAGHHHMKQPEINDLLLSLARTGRFVVRLKGGDPFVFGRGSEEALHLARHGIRFEVVPGITAASGSAYAGIPLTHRGYAGSVRFLTGHSGEATTEIDWRGAADRDTTLVIYMGLSHLPEIVAELRAGGLPDDHPAALIQQATTPNQRRIVGTLADLPRLAEESGLSAPVLTIVGRVAELAEALDWFTSSGGEANDLRDANAR